MTTTTSTTTPSGRITTDQDLTTGTTEDW